jgi:hypothetical protein
VGKQHKIELDKARNFFEEAINAENHNDRSTLFFKGVKEIKSFLEKNPKTEERQFIQNMLKTYSKPLLERLCQDTAYSKENFEVYFLIYSLLKKIIERITKENPELEPSIEIFADYIRENSWNLDKYALDI